MIRLTWVTPPQLSHFGSVEKKGGCYASVEGPAMLMAAMGRVTTSLGIPKRLFRRPEACQTSRNPKEKVNARPKPKDKAKREAYKMGK